MHVRIRIAVIHVLFLILLPLFCSHREEEDKDLHKALRQFANRYRSLDIREVVFDYTDRLFISRKADNLEKQEAFFEEADKSALSFEPAKLDPGDRLRWHQWRYEIARHKGRISLEKRFRETAGTAITNAGIYYQPMGADWYRYFLHFYLDTSQTPEKLKAMGWQQVQAVQENIKGLEGRMARSTREIITYLAADSFYIRDERKVVEKYAAKYAVVQSKLPGLFRHADHAGLHFAPITFVDSDSPPGYYLSTNATYYFNFLNDRHHRKDMDFLFLHEGVPGHHYQGAYVRKHAASSALQGLFWYAAYVEGWGAYSETLGKDLGLYATAAEEMGALQWDLVRSLRVVLDVGLNYEGWSREKAMDVWKAQIKGQDAIAEREINRIIRWPVQVISYKYGADQLLKMKEMAKVQGNFNCIDFHERILEDGPLPMPVLWMKFSK